MANRIIVDANYRFIAAYQEVNARIAQRQHALALYVTLVVSLLAAVVALRPGRDGGDIPIEWLALGFPVASTALAFLNYKAEKAITNLRRFLSELEKLDGADTELPSYNTDPKWAMDANQARRYHDFAAAVLVAGGNAIGLAAVVEVHPERMAANPAVVLIGAVVSLACFVALLVNSRWSFRPGST